MLSRRMRYAGVAGVLSFVVWLGSAGTSTRVTDAVQPILIRNMSCSPNPALVGQPVSCGATVLHDDSTTLASTVWNMGDGTVFNQRTFPPYAYTAPGTYTVTLTATDSAGMTGQATTSLQVTEPAAMPAPVSQLQPAPTATTTPPPPKVRVAEPLPPGVSIDQLVRLGGVDWSGYCRSLGETPVHDGTDLFNSWHCITADGLHFAIPVGNVCRWQYGRSDVLPAYTDPNDANTWGCYALPGGSATAPSRPAPAPSAPEAAAPNAFIWDFTDCRGHGVSSDVESDDLQGSPGCHAVLSAGGQTSIDTSFTITGDPAAAGTWSIILVHAASIAGGSAGDALVRVSLNGQVVFDAGPRGNGAGPGGLWALYASDVTSLLQTGTNTLHWELGDGATSDYWLKSAGISAPVKTPSSRPPEQYPPDTPPGGIA